MKLDVGCGCNPKGDVNCDLFLVDTENHRAFDTYDMDRLRNGKIPNLVCCDGRFLPFRDGAFNEVFSGQLIEHLENPIGFLRELARVSCHRVVIETLHRLGEAFNWKQRKWFKTHHVSKFNRSWFIKAGRVCRLSVQRSFVLDRIGFPLQELPIFQFPYNIRVEMVKC